jgi:HEAT repeat protein
VDGQAAKRATRGLAALAADANPDVVTVAMETLTRTETLDPEAAPVLIPLLSSTNDLWAMQSATALGRLGADAAAAVPGLVKMLDDERIETRRAATGVLSKFGGLAGAALPALLKGVEHPDRRYAADCLAAIKAIGAKPDEGAVRVLDGIARRGDPTLAVLAVEALATMGTNAPAAFESLRQAVGHRDRAVREAAFAGLCALNSPPIPELARMLSGGEDTQRRAWAAEKVAALGPAAGALKAIGSEVAETARQPLAGADRKSRGADLTGTTLETLEAINAPPAVQDEKQNLATCRQAESVVVEFLPWICDPDTPETKLRVVVVDPPVHGAFERRSATAWLYTPERSFIGQDGFKWKADDGQAQSPVAGGVISVTGDTQPPVIVSVQALGSNDEVVVKLNEPILRDGAEDKANFAIDRGAEVRGSSLDKDGQTVTLKTSPLMRRTTYTLSVRNLKDRSIRGNVADATARFQYMPVAAWKAAAAKAAQAGAESVPEDEVSP